MPIKPISLLGQKRTNHRGPKSTVVRCSPKADIRERGWNVRFVPIAPLPDVRATSGVIEQHEVYRGRRKWIANVKDQEPVIPAEVCELD
jgi:hypothetical protein